MSFITLKSELHNNYINSSESAATFTNNFETPVVLGPGNTLQVVACTIHKTIGYNVHGSDNTFLWRIGVGIEGPAPLSQVAEMLQHRVTIPSGYYTGDELAAEIKKQLNDTTIIGMFKGLWTCTYTEAVDAGPGTTFDIAWSQQATPVAAPDLQGLTLNLAYDQTGLIPMVGGFSQSVALGECLPTPPFLPNQGFQFVFPDDVNNGTLIRQLNTKLTFIPGSARFPLPSSALNNRAYEEQFLSYIGDRSVFANGGIITNISRPTLYVEEYSWAAIGPDVAITNFNNEPGNDLLGAITVAGAPYAALGWQQKIVMPPGGEILTKVIDSTGLAGILVIALVSGGTNYNVGDTGPIMGGVTGVNATYYVDTVGVGGVITAAHCQYSGNGYTDLDTVALEHIAGLDATVQIFGVEPFNGRRGAGYAVATPVDTLAFTGTGSGCTVNITAVSGTGVMNAFSIVDSGTGYVPGDIVFILKPGNVSGDGMAAFIVVTANPAHTGPGVLYLANDEAGCVGLATEPVAAVESAIEDNCDFAYFKPESNAAGVFMATTAYLSQLEQKDTSCTGGPTGGVPMSLHHDFLVPQTEIDIVYAKTHPSFQTAFVRNSLVQAIDGVVSNIEYTTNPGEADLQVNLFVRPDNTGMDLEIIQMDDNSPGVAFPNPGWRVTDVIMNDDLLTLFNAGASPGYLFATSSIKVEIKIDAIKNVSVEVSHNGAGTDADAFGVATIMAVSGLLAGNMPLRPIEAHYPLRPFLSSATGLPFDPPALVPPLPYTPTNGGLVQQYVGGIYDTKKTSQDGLELYGINLNPQTQAHIPAAPGPPGPVSLPFLLKAGNIEAADQYIAPAAPTVRTISSLDVQPNMANIWRLIAYHNIYNETVPAAFGGTGSNLLLAPQTTGGRSTIQVEMPDFNIESWSGKSTDRGRAVGVIPTEEWSTGDTVGTLHYQSQYSRPIELNLPYSKPFYSLECRLRDLNGRVAQGLDNSTELVLLVGTTEESKHQRVMDQSMEKLAALMANKEESKISQQPDGFMGI